MHTGTIQGTGPCPRYRYTCTVCTLVYNSGYVTYRWNTKCFVVALKVDTYIISWVLPRISNPGRCLLFFPAVPTKLGGGGANLLIVKSWLLCFMQAHCSQYKNKPDPLIPPERLAVAAAPAASQETPACEQLQTAGGSHSREMLAPGPRVSPGAVSRTETDVVHYRY
jgi:hypothetical protein